MSFKERFFSSNISISQLDVKGKVLSRSLLWMGLGLTFIVLVAYLTSSFAVFENFMLRISFGSNWLMILLFNITLMIGLMFTLYNPKISIWIPITLYAVFAIYEGIFISSLLYISGSLNVSRLLLFMLIPAGVFGLMGIVAYFDLVDFSKTIPFLIFGSLILLILGITLIFVNSGVLEKVYLFLSALIFIVWIGFDIQMIKRTEEKFLGINQFDDKEMKKTLNRLSLIFGISLFIDFIRLLWVVIRFFLISRE